MNSLYTFFPLVCNAHPDKDKFAVSYGHSEHRGSDLKRCSSLQRGLVLPNHIFLSPPEKYFLQSCLETGTFPISWSQAKITFCKETFGISIFKETFHSSHCPVTLHCAILLCSICSLLHLHHFTSVLSLSCQLCICSKTSGG